jgi:hypothetical protein
MRWLKKIVLIIVIVFLIAFGGIGTYALINEEKLTAELVKRVNETINTKISYGKVGLTVIRTFPNITVNFTDILVSPSPFYDKTQFRQEDNDTLLFASSLSISISIPSLVTGNVAVRSVGVRDGEVNMLTDKRGDTNFEVFSTEKKGSGKTIKLRNISARNMKTTWCDRSSDLRIAAGISDVSLGGEIFKSGIFLNASARADIDSVNVREMKVAGIPLSADIKMRKSNNSLSVAKGSLGLADLKFDIGGNINFKSSNVDLSVSGRKINIASVFSMLPDRYRSMAGNFSPAGIVDFSCTVKGPYGKAGTPHLEMLYNLTGGRLSHTISGFRVNNLEFRGGINNGKLNSSESFQCTIDNLSATYGSSSIKGTFMLNSLVRPHVSLSLNGDLDLDDLGRLISGGLIHDQSGTVKAAVTLSGFIPENAGSRMAVISSLNPDISLVFGNFGIAVASSGFNIKNVNGMLEIRNDLIADSLSLTVMDQHFTVNGNARNFSAWLAGKPERMDIEGSISADRFVPLFFTGNDNDTTAGDKSSPNYFPPGITADIMLTADSIVSKDFGAANFTGELEYGPFVYTVRNISAEALDGAITGEFMLGKQKDGGYVTKSTVHASGIDIKKAFASFSNFGQTFISSDNLKGNLTGNITALIPLDNTFRIVQQSVVAESHLVVTNGRLVDFPPAESLSSYLDLDELKDISFSSMENDLFINNRVVSIPKMLVNSSAVNFTLYGTHNFNGNYSYHVRLLLSEVLSRKARERNRNDSAFGRVQVDGTGKATIPLKIECTGDQTDVSYDFGQAQDNIKGDIALEKQTLKGILNEEYGWYKSDTLKTRPAGNKPKFTITWEEGRDTVPKIDSSAEEVSESPLKLLLKKKR